MADPSAEAHYRAVQKLWDSERPVHALTTPEYFAAFAKNIFAQLKPGGRRLLDVACGTGDVMSFLAAHGLDCYGFDFADAKIREAAQKNPGRVWKQSFLEPFKNGPYDYVVSITAVQYCRPSELADFLRHSIDALVVGGQCLHTAVPVMELFEGAKGVYYRVASDDEINVHRTRFEVAARTGIATTQDGTFFHSCAAARKIVEDMGHAFRAYDMSRYRMNFEIVRQH